MSPQSWTRNGPHGASLPCCSIRDLGARASQPAATFEPSSAWNESVAPAREYPAAGWKARTPPYFTEALPPGVVDDGGRKVQEHGHGPQVGKARLNFFAVEQGMLVLNVNPLAIQGPADLVNDGLCLGAAEVSQG